ncbi:unnamed protein product [Effrenium voratum]|nr:unnamed protein product [Effrenium voratum]
MEEEKIDEKSKEEKPDKKEAHKEPVEEVKLPAKSITGTGSFTVTVPVKDHSTLGLDVDLTDELAGPMIIEVKKGAIQSFNEKNPGQVIQQYDLMTTLDTVKGTAAIFERLNGKLPQESATISFMRPRQVKVTVSKPGGLGMKLDYKTSSVGAVVSELIDSGLISKWNNEHPADAVSIGDRIIELNGKKLLGLELVDQIKKESKLTLTVLKY